MRLRSLLILCLPSLLAAQKAPQPWAGQGPNASATHAPSTEGSGEIVALEQILRLSDAQLQAMANAIERVRQMSPQERERLHIEIAAYRKLPPNTREQIRSGWVSENDWTDWRTMMQELSETERTAIQASLQALPFEQRAERKHALLEDWRAGSSPND